MLAFNLLCCECVGAGDLEYYYFVGSLPTFRERRRLKPESSLTVDGSVVGTSIGRCPNVLRISVLGPGH